MGVKKTSFCCFACRSVLVRSDEALSNINEKYHGINVLARGNEAFQTKWSDPASGQKQHAGWHGDGLAKFKALLEAVKNGRNTAENKAMEERILQELRTKEGITATTYAEHLRQKKKRPVEVDDEEEELDLLSDSEPDV